MSFFSRTKTSRTANPPETKGLTENLVAQVWQSVRRSGELALHWGLARKNPDDSASPYRTLRVESIFEVPLFLSKLALAFSKVDGLAKELRAELEEFSRHLMAVVELRSSNGADLVPPRAGPESILGG